MLDLEIPGDPAGIRTLANWLAPEVNDLAGESYVEMVAVRTDSEHYWTGESGPAFRETAIRVGQLTAPVDGFMRRAADVFLAYANRLERGQEDFDALLTQAGAAGLTLVRRSRQVLNPTTWVDYCPTEGSPEADVEEWERYVAAVGVYTELSSQVGTWWGELEAWLVEHMVPLTVQVDEFAPLADFFEGLSVGNEDVVGAAIEGASFRASRDLTEWSAVRDALQADADKFSAGIRSGNPALRAASNAANPRALRQGLRALAEEIGKLARIARVIPGIGVAAEVIAAGVEISEGASPSSVGVGVVGGLLGGLGVGAGIAAAGGPPGVVIGGTIILGTLIGEGARWGYEAAVPLNIRESIDDWLLGNTPVLVNEATGSWAVGTK